MVGHQYLVVPSISLHWKFLSKVRFFLVGSNSWNSITFVFSPVFVVIGITFAAAYYTDRCLCWYRCPLYVISDSGRYFEISFAVSPGHVAKDPSFISWIMVSFVRHQSI